MRNKQAPFPLNEAIVIAAIDCIIFGTAPTQVIGTSAQVSKPGSAVQTYFECKRTTKNAIIFWEAVYASPHVML